MVYSCKAGVRFSISQNKREGNHFPCSALRISKSVFQVLYFTKSSLPHGWHWKQSNELFLFWQLYPLALGTEGSPRPPWLEPVQGELTRWERDGARVYTSVWAHQLPKRPFNHDATVNVGKVAKEASIRKYRTPWLKGTFKKKKKNPNTWKHYSLLAMRSRHSIMLFKLTIIQSRFGIAFCLGAMGLVSLAVYISK